MSEPVVITEPGVYPHMPEDVYHGDPVPAGSLSASGAKKLIPPSVPAVFEHERKNPPEPTQAMELGTAAHKLVLGVGQEFTIIAAENWRTNKAKDAADEARAAGKIPLLPHEHETVQGMAAALRSHKLASALFNPERGIPEASAFWYDQRWGIWRRCRYDWMPDLGARPFIGDYKTCISAGPKAFAKAVANFRYDIQADTYCEGYRAIFGPALAEDPKFIFVAQEKEPPYLVATYQLDREDLAAARKDNDEACERFRDCTEAGIWPGYPEDVMTMELPRWFRTREDYL